MHDIYVTVLLACTALIVALIAWRLATMRRHPRPDRSRLINEWIWTLIPLLMLAVLLWDALRR